MGHVVTLLSENHGVSVMCSQLGGGHMAFEIPVF